MPYLQYIWTALVLALLLRELSALYGITLSIRFLLRGARQVPARSAERLDVLIIVPVLRETTVIESTVRYFRSLAGCNVDVVVVTTERERIEAGDSGEPTTFSVVRRLQKRLALTHIHYPCPQGTKADQINYAVRCLSQRMPREQWDQCFVACYDADSRPHPQTLEGFQRAAQTHPGVRVFQQSSLFYSNAEALVATDGAVARAFLLGNAVRQARFTLAYELPRIRSRLAYYRARARKAWLRNLHIGRFRYAHTVGHGLFVRLDLIVETPLPTGSVLEDMFYGFMLNLMHEPVVPLSILDNCETPGNVSSLFWQRTRWFLGPGRPLQYLEYSREHVPVRANRFEQCAVTASCAIDAAIWAGVTPMALGVLLTWLVWASGLSPAARIPSLIGLAAGIVYLTTFALTLVAPCERLGIDWRPRASHVVVIFAGLPLVVLFHSLPAYHCLYRRLASNHRPDVFGKTER